MGSAADEFKYSDPGSTGVPVDWFTITPSATVFSRPIRAIRANGAGTVTAGMGGGSRVLNFLAGETRYGVFLSVTAATATGLEGGI